MYHHIRLTDRAILSGPGPLPYVVGNWPDELVADLTGKVDPAFDFDGTGFWPDAVTTPSFDPASQTLAGTVSWTVDPNVLRVNGVEDIRALTTDELAAALSGAQQAKLAALSAACAAQIVGGYTSSALGAVYTYPSTPTDQANMVASVVKSTLPGLPSDWTTPFWCADGSGAWSMRQHNATQIQQAGSDGFAAIAAAQIKNASLGAEVMQATTAAAVNAIHW